MRLCLFSICWPLSRRQIKQIGPYVEAYPLGINHYPLGTGPYPLGIGPYPLGTELYAIGK